MTVPFVVILALVLGNATKNPKSATTSGPPGPKALPAITAVGPAANTATAPLCTMLLTALPVQLGELAQRIVHPKPDSPFVVAWGDPAVVLRCGVERPAALKPGSAELLVGVNGVFWLPVQRKDATVWTAVDRGVYIELSVPKSYPQPPLGPVSDAVARVLAQVCSVDSKETDVTKLCTNRK